MLWFDRLLDTRMPRPAPWGLYHIAWFVAALLFAFALRSQNDEKATRRIFAVFGWVAFALEALTQLSWGLSPDASGRLVWDYEWYAAPFQLCTTPIFVCILYPAFKSERVRAALRAYLAYFTFTGSLAVAAIPDTIYTQEVLINLHTAFLHLGALSVSLWLLIHGRAGRADFWGGYAVFLLFTGLALALDVLVYHVAPLGGETFNMFFISPYFVSTLPVFGTIWRTAPYPVFLLCYLVAFTLGGLIVLGAQQAALAVKSRLCRA